MIGPVERIPLSTRAEVSRALGWGRDAMAERDARFFVNLAVAGTTNVVAAAFDRWRPARWWCPCCDRTTGSFVASGNQLRLSRHAWCPGCGSRSRHRALALALADLTGPRLVGDVLHFAPEPPVTTVLARQLSGARILTTDLNRDDVDRPGEDIQALSFEADSFDLVICNHVLEHVADDREAAAELARVVRPGGLVLVTVPGDWSRPDTVTFPDLAFNGHHRDYGNDVVDLLETAFARVGVLVFADLEPGDDRPGQAGLRADDRLFVCEG